MNARKRSEASRLTAEHTSPIPTDSKAKDAASARWLTTNRRGALHSARLFGRYTNIDGVGKHCHPVRVGMLSDQLLKRCADLGIFSFAQL